MPNCLSRDVLKPEKGGDTTHPLKSMVGGCWSARLMHGLRAARRDTTARAAAAAAKAVPTEPGRARASPQVVCRMLQQPACDRRSNTRLACAGQGKMAC